MTKKALLLAALSAALAWPSTARADGACADNASCTGDSSFPPVGFPSSFPPPASGSGTPPSLPPPEADVPLSASRVQMAVERYPTGEILAERRTFDGVFDGPSKEYYKNGQVMNASTYRKGRLHGESLSYYRNGDLKTEWKYKNGKLHGETRHYFERKILKSVETYRDGALVKRKTFNEKGLPVDEAR